MSTKSRGLVRPGWAFVALALIAVSTACASTSTPSATSSAADFSPAATPAPLGSGQAGASSQPTAPPREAARSAPDFSIQTVAGERFSLAAQRGKSVSTFLSRALVK